MNLEAVQGVGPALATAIREKFPSDDAFLEAAREGNLQALEAVDGLTPKRAVDLVRQVRGEADSDQLLATKGTRKVHEHIMNELRRFAATPHGRNRLRLLGPLSDPEAASRRMQHIMSQKTRLQSVDDIHLRRLLRRLKPLEWPSPVCDMTQQVVVPDDDALEDLHAQGIGRWALLVTPREASEDCDLTIAAYGDGGNPEGDVDVPQAAGLAGLAPHAWLAWARHNAATIQALSELAELMGTQTTAGEMPSVEVSPPAPIADLRTAIATIKADLDDELEASLDNLQISGADMMRAMSQNTLPAPLEAAVEAARNKGRQLVTAACGVSIQPFLATFPLELDEDEVARIEASQQLISRRAQFEAQQRCAKDIADLAERLDAEVASWLEDDANLALGAFAKTYDLQPAHFGETLRFEQSVHLDLAANPNVQRINYHMQDANRIVLTGANSGGKSTLLEHLTQLVVMSHMGLPTVGQVTVPWYDALHLVTARRGLDAGAFETFLRHFLPIADAPGRCLVLADEVESVTELEAAGRILAFFLDRLAKTDSHCILVSHMAEPILRHVEEPVRIDGIEATGLDEDNQLIVDRQPKMGHFARSTPELIVQRMARENGALAGLFSDLLQTLQHPKNA